MLSERPSTSNSGWSWCRQGGGKRLDDEREKVRGRRDHRRGRTVLGKD